MKRLFTWEIILHLIVKKYKWKSESWKWSNFLSKEKWIIETRFTTCWYGKCNPYFNFKKIDMCCNVTYPFEVYTILSRVFFWSFFYHFIFTKKFHASLAKRKSFLEQFSFSCLLSCTNSFLYLCLRSCHRVFYKVT